MAKIELRRWEGGETIHAARGGSAAGRLWLSHCHSDFRDDGGDEGKRERRSERVKAREVRRKAKAFGGSGGII